MDFSKTTANKAPSALEQIVRALKSPETVLDVLQVT